MRLIVSFTLTSAQSVKVQILLDDQGTGYVVDAEQLKNNPYSNAYTMPGNGNFDRSLDGWSKTFGVSGSAGTRFNMNRSLVIGGNLDSERYADQIVKIKTNRSIRETFTLSGWTKVYGLPAHGRGGAPGALDSGYGKR